MTTETIREAIKNRSLTDDEWDYGVEQCWKTVLALMAGNHDEVVDFIENECTADEFSLLSEIYSDIIDVLPSGKIIDALRKTAGKYPDESKKYNLHYCIDMAEGHLDFIRCAGT